MTFKDLYQYFKNEHSLDVLSVGASVSYTITSVGVVTIVSKLTPDSIEVWAGQRINHMIKIGIMTHEADVNTLVRGYFRMQRDFISHDFLEAVRRNQLIIAHEGATGLWNFIDFSPKGCANIVGPSLPDRIKMDEILATAIKINKDESDNDPF